MDEGKVVEKISAARYLGIKGDRAIYKSMRDFMDCPVPELGKIYLFNEIAEENGEAGRPKTPIRLICRPKEYTGWQGCLLLCEYFTSPDERYQQSFRVEDFRKGIIRTQELSEYIYVNFFRGSFSWADLSIDDPHPDIRKLYIT